MRWGRPPSTSVCGPVPDDLSVDQCRILSHEVVQADGVPRLAAGQWATGQRATLNPGYWAVPILRDLARRTHERRWDAGAACRARP